MVKRVIQCEVYSYGIYTRWDRTSKALPKLVEITAKIPIKEDIEFGYVLKIKSAKGKLLTYIIEHPEMVDDDRNQLPPFEGTVIVSSNNYDFFLGDTVWEPYSQMIGEWNLITKIEDRIIVQKKLMLFL